MAKTGVIKIQLPGDKNVSWDSRSRGRKIRSHGARTEYIKATITGRFSLYVFYECSKGSSRVTSPRNTRTRELMRR